jgi:hypothetical protein
LLGRQDRANPLHRPPVVQPNALQQRSRLGHATAKERALLRRGVSDRRVHLPDLLADAQQFGEQRPVALGEFVADGLEALHLRRRETHIRAPFQQQIYRARPGELAGELAPFLCRRERGQGDERENDDPECAHDVISRTRSPSPRFPSIHLGTTERWLGPG